MKSISSKSCEYWSFLCCLFCSSCIDDDDSHNAKEPDGLLPQRLLQGIEHGQVVGEHEEPDLGSASIKCQTLETLEPQALGEMHLASEAFGVRFGLCQV